jgi:hypothetical protein
LADLALAMDPGSGAISPQERFGAWGSERIGALRGLIAAIEPAVPVWRDANTGGVAIAMRLAPGVSEENVATHLRHVLGARLAWDRGAAGDRIGWVGFTVEARPSAEGDARIALRFVKAGRGSALVVASDAAMLEKAGPRLESLGR